MVEWRIRWIGSCGGKYDGEWWISLWKWNRYELDIGISLEVFSVFAVLWFSLLAYCRSNTFSHSHELSETRE